MIKNKTVIILVNYNGFEDTRDCIRSIKKSAGELPYIIVVDNASNDCKGLELLRKEYELLKLIYNKENIGFGRANNLGIRWAQEHLEFEFLLLLNNDTLIEPETIEYLIEPFYKDPHIGVTTGKTMYEGKRDIVWYGGGEINYRRGWPKIADYNNVATEEGANKSKYVSFISGCTMMFSKDSISTIKGFDEIFFMYCEDLELCISAIKKGYKLFYQSKSVIYHKVQGSLKGNSKNIKDNHPKSPNLSFLFYNMKTNQFLTFKKHLSGYNYFYFIVIYYLNFFIDVVKILLNKRFDMLGTFKKVIVHNFKIKKNTK